MDPALKTLGEFGLIQRIIDKIPRLPPKRWPAGIGDDTSVLKVSDHHYQLLTHDLFLEGSHFLTPPPQGYADLGWKALAVNLSDIAAMGGVPQEAVVGLGIPPKARLKDVDTLYRGLIECSQAFHCPLVGGDTNASKRGWVLAVTVTGYTGRPPKLRSGARVGDSLWVTGTFGGAALGWEAMRKRSKSRSTAPFRRKQSRPQARLHWGQRLGENAQVTAMIDCSDGLAGDLRHLGRASGVGIELEVDQVPRLPGFEKVARSLKQNPINLLLTGGEDYELIFTLAAKSESEMPRWLQRYDICAKKVGRVVAGEGVHFFQAGIELKKQFRGFSHF